MRRAALFGVVGVLSLTAGDWLNLGGDAQHSGWQRRGKSIGVENAGQIKLLWKRKLGLEALTAPVMLGPIVTHRGIKELVFVGAGANDIYAVDADLGRVFWKRHIDGPAVGSCGPMATPATAPPPPGSKVSEDDDEGHTPMRPFYFVASDGVLHTIRPADGVDMAPAKSFVPALANLSALTFAGGVVYATTSNGCGGVADGVWAIDTADAQARARFVAGKSGGVSVGADGTVYAARGGGIVALAAGALKENASYEVSMNGDAPSPFLWKGRTLLIGAGRAGELVMMDSGKVESRHVGDTVHGLATWVDPSGTRWVYAAVDKKIAAFRLAERNGSAILVPDWNSGDLGLCLAPVIANGVVYALAQSTKAVVYALDARTGKQVYSSGNAISPLVRASELGVANGHICFGTSDGMLYCFGLPLEI